MKITIKDIARKANVSTATVSRVINNVDLNKVSEATRKKVRAVINEHKYFPDIAGISLATGRNNTLGLIIPGENFLTYSYYFSEILRGVVRAANEFNYRLSLLTCEINGAEIFKNYVRGKIIEGLIFVGSEIEDRRIYELKEEKIPFVLVNNYIKGLEISYIDSDNRKGAYEATEYFIKSGHKKIAMLKGPDVSMNALDRYEGFVEAMSSYQIPVRTEYVKTGNFNSQMAYQSMKELLNLSDLPTAIFASDDTMAITAMTAIKERGLSIPDDISIIGFNNSPESTVVTPQLTTVEQNIFTVGYEAAHMLITILRKGGIIYPSKIINTELIIRKSCRKLA